MSKRISNLFFIGLIAFFLYQKIPLWIEQYKQEGSPSLAIQVQSLQESLPIKLPLLEQPHVIVFWATWCGPCSIELARINKLIESHKIPANRVIAISSGESRDLVLKHVLEKQYLFQVALDPKFEASTAYKVRGTPTLVLVDKQGRIDWMTMGLSASLELRLIQALTGTQDDAEVL